MEFYVITKVIIFKLCSEERDLCHKQWLPTRGHVGLLGLTTGQVFITDRTKTLSVYTGKSSLNSDFRDLPKSEFRFPKNLLSSPARIIQIGYMKQQPTGPSITR